MGGWLRTSQSVRAWGQNFVGGNTVSTLTAWARARSVDDTFYDMRLLMRYGDHNRPAKHLEQGSVAARSAYNLKSTQATTGKEQSL